jgi:hypothetical protein
MKSELFLALPVLVTLFNVSLAILFYGVHNSDAQPVLQEGLAGRCLDNTGEAFHVALEEYLLGNDTLNDAIAEETVEDDGEEPQLMKMPGINFKAYVRADIATFYREKPGSRVVHKPDFNGQAGKFVNMSPDPVDLHWDGGLASGPQLNDHLGPWQAGGTATFPTHKFIFTKPGRPDEVLCRMTVVPGVSMYYCDPFTDENSHPSADPRSRGVQLSGGNRSVDSLSAQDRANYEAHKFNLHFGSLYQNFTGTEWLTMYPKSPPKHKIWRADYFGQEHQVQTKETQFLKIPPTEKLHRLKRSEQRRHDDSFAEYRAPGEMNITIKALSCTPRAFEVRNFLSDFEADYLLDIVNKGKLERSTTNGHLSETRTSSTTWIPRDTDQIVDAIFRRVADTLRLDESLLRDRDPDEHPEMPTRQRLNEELQIVHYDKVSFAR